MNLTKFPWPLLTDDLSTLALHFRRPVSFWPDSEIRQIIGPDPFTPIAINNSVLRISESLSLQPRPSQERLEHLIPLQLRVLRSDKGPIPFSSATIYLALHPVFTDYLSDLCSDHTSTTQIISTGLLEIIAASASVVIDRYVQLQEEHMLLSVWIAAERVLEAGAVWATYLLIVKEMQTDDDANSACGNTKKSMLPLWKCGNLLTSCAERWKGGRVYCKVWETFLSMISHVLR